MNLPAFSNRTWSLRGALCKFGGALDAPPCDSDSGAMDSLCDADAFFTTLYETDLGCFGDHRTFCPTTSSERPGTFPNSCYDRHHSRYPAGDVDIMPAPAYKCLTMASPSMLKAPLRRCRTTAVTTETNACFRPCHLKPICLRSLTPKLVNALMAMLRFVTDLDTSPNPDRSSRLSSFRCRTPSTAGRQSVI